MNYIWSGMMLISVVFGAVNGRMSQVSDAAFSGTRQAVELCVVLLGTICLWSGLIRIADKAGLTRVFSRLLRPFIKLVFPGLDPVGPAARAICMNMSANMMGLGNAATPLGLEAMKHLQEGNPVRDTASDPMIMLVVMNTASLQIIPATVAALRSRHGSASPMDIMPAVWLASVLSLAAGLVFAKLLMVRRGKKARPAGEKQ